MTNKRFPKYPDDADYNTNSPSYYDDLARKQKLMQLLAERIWDYDDEIKEYFKRWEDNLENINEDVIEMMVQWSEDGTLDHIINDTIFNWKADKTYVDSEIERLDQKDEDLTEQKADKTYVDDLNETVTTQMTQIIEDDAVSPEQFEGNDHEKLQQAVNYIVSKKGGAVALSRMYNLTGYPPINIPKTESKDRSPLIFSGRGGGILKEDSGWMFDSETRNVGDVYFSNVIFESISGRGTGIINGNNLIRTQWHDSHARNVDRILHSDTYTQSNVFNGGSIVGGSGWAFNSEGYYDFLMTGGFLVEHRQHFFRQEVQGGTGNIHNALYNVRFRDIIVEGLWGKTFDIQRVESLVVDGVYLEHNQGGYFDFTRADNIDAVQISNVRCYNSPDFVVDNNLKALIVWGGRLYGVSTHNIFSRNLPVHDATSSQSHSIRIYSHQDIALDSSRNTIENIDPYNLVIEENKRQTYRLTLDNGAYMGQSRLGITSNNLDDYIKTGTFNVNSASSTNTPDVENNWGILEVKDLGSGTLLQTYIERPSSRMHIRSRSDGIWGDWVPKQTYELTSQRGSYTMDSGTTSKDLNDFIKTGTFNIDGDTHNNTPNGDDRWGILEVKDMGSDIIMQTYIQRPSTTVHIRLKDGAIGWRSWALK